MHFLKIAVFSSDIFLMKKLTFHITFWFYLQNLVPHIILLCALANLRQGGDIKTPLSNSAQQLQNKALRRVNLKLLW